MKYFMLDFAVQISRVWTHLNYSCVCWLFHQEGKPQAQNLNNSKFLHNINLPKSNLPMCSMTSLLDKGLTIWWQMSNFSDSNIAIEHRGFITAPFNNMQTLKFKAQPTNWFFFATINRMFGGSSQLPTMLSELCSTIWFDYRALSSSWKLGGAVEHLIDGREKCICRVSFECYWKVQ